MRVIGLSGASGVDLVGGKAAGLGAMVRLGLRVPDGFCVTTEAWHDGEIPRAEILAAYERLGGGPVAVRSSAVAEDSPDASYAGQLDTVLDVRGGDALLAAVRQCWDSASGERAVAYRAGSDAFPMAVVVQPMVDAEMAGVLFTANPVTGCRTEMLVDAAPGLGTAVVDGGAEVDHYVLRAGEAAAEAWLGELWNAGERLAEHFGSPQDIEWAIDRQGILWFLQSRPITTLFPLAPPTEGPQPRIYLEFGHVQGMLRPATPMGMSGLKELIAAMLVPLGLRVEITDIGGRLYGDLSDLARDPAARKRLVKLLAVDFGPRAQAAMEQVLADPRFAPRPGRAKSAGPSLGTAGRAVGGILRALARPDAARHRLTAAVERLRISSAAPAALETPAERMAFVRAQDSAEPADEIIWPIVAGMLASAIPAQLLKGIADQDEIHAVLAGMPHNVTLEMDLALWRIAQGVGEHRRLLLDTPPAELAARYRNSGLPEIGLTAFLDAYGHRGAAEVDLGVPRWDEDPAPVFAALANYLRVTDPGQRPDRRFARAAEDAELALRELAAKVRRRRPIRGGLAVFLLRRARRLAGLREAGKFAGLYRLREMRRQLLLIGDDLAAAGLLDDGPDIMFLTMGEADDAVRAHLIMDKADDAVRRKADQRAVVAARKVVHRRELRRQAVPVAVLSDGTEIEALTPLAADLTGVGASAGRATGPARVVDDPATAHLEPGEILVAATTDPGWTPLFLTAAGLVTETGAIMAHGPTVAREYGIPAVISVPAATRRITTGQIITVDGRRGTVTFEGEDA